MPHVIRSFEEVTPDWIRQVLGSDSARVSSCRATREWDTLITRVALVHLDYTALAPGRPTSVFIKIAKQNQDRELKKICAREVLFYSQIAGLLPAQCIPRCYLAVHDQESDDFCIVLEDLSVSHLQTEYPLPPSIDWCRSAVRCLAQIHAAGWNHGELGPMLGRFHSREAVEYWSGFSRRVWEQFSRFLGDRLSDGRRRVVDQVMGNIERVLGRTLGTEQQTILHRDTHLWNFFFPREDHGEVKLFDWQLCEYGMAADDLVPMIALNWYPERRIRFEKLLLKDYHVTLDEAGVKSYGIKELETEYRWSVLKELVTPMLQWHHNVAAGVWFNNLEKILLAVEDLNCMELLKRKSAI